MTLDDISGDYSGPVWLVCGGPSVRGFDFSRLKGTVAAINEIGCDIPNLDLWIGNDRLPEYPKEFWSRDCLKLLRREQKTRPATVKNLCEFPSRTQRQTLDVRRFFEGAVVWGAPARHNGGIAVKKSAMLMSFGVLYRLGFREVRLIGCDWASHQAEPYGHDHKQTDENDIRKANQQFRFLEQWFFQLIPLFKHEGLSVLNCTDGGQLDLFERRDWRDFCA